jgi:hypothetical protein
MRQENRQDDRALWVRVVTVFCALFDRQAGPCPGPADGRRDVRTGTGRYPRERRAERVPLSFAGS